jgi:hypothetical protein
MTRSLAFVACLAIWTRYYLPNDIEMSFMGAKAKHNKVSISSINAVGGVVVVLRT